MLFVGEELVPTRCLPATSSDRSLRNTASRSARTMVPQCRLAAWGIQTRLFAGTLPSTPFLVQFARHLRMQSCLKCKGPGQGALVDCRKVTITSCYASKLVWRQTTKSPSPRTNVLSPSLPAGYVFRAKLILMLAEGASFNAIKRCLQTSAPTIIRWKQRFLQSGLDGLDTYHPGQPATVLTPALHARILSATRKKPSDGSTHWSCRKLAAALGVSKDAVHRVWKQAGLKPHRLERYLASDDPEFERKAADILGLYLNPPQHAAVFCVDEKTAIQALDRLDPVLPLSPGRAERHGFEYYRHGTLSLYAALDTKTGRVHGKTAARHTSRDFVA